MSSILNRLKEVEGATFQREAVTDRPPSPEPYPSCQTSPTDPTPRARLKSAPSDATQWLYRLLPGVLALLVLLVVWRPWGSQSPGGKHRSQGSRPTLAASRKESPLADVNASELKESHETRVVAAKPRGTEPIVEAASSLSNPQGSTAATVSDGSARSNGSDKPGVGPAEIRNQESESSTEPPAESRPAAAVAPNDAPVKAFLRSLSVTGVYQDAAGYIAFINGRALQEGDELGQVQIVEIRSGRITFAREGKRYVLPLR